MIPEHKKSGPGFRDYGLTIAAHIVFGAAAIYFAYLFFHFELSFAFLRNLGVAVTFWASLGLAFNFAMTNTRMAEPWLAGLNIAILGASVFLCLVAMANHNKLILHAIVIHIVLTLSAIWTWVAREYYSKTSEAWHEWYSKLFDEDLKQWLAYLSAAYLPFFVPTLIKHLHLAGSANDAIPEQVVGACSDGVTGFVLFFEFFSFWWNIRKQRDVLIKHAAEIIAEEAPNLRDEALARILSTKTIRLGCLHWPPVVDCEVSGTGHSPGGFYGKWAGMVAANNHLDVVCVPVAWHDMKQQLQTENVDFIVCAFETDSRKKYASFSKAYHECAMMGVAHVGPEIWNEETVKEPHVKIVVAKNEVGFEYAKKCLNFAPERHDPRFTVIETCRIEEVASVVLGGGNEYVGIADALSIHIIQKKHAAELRVVLDDPSLKTYDVAIMFAKGQESLRIWIESEFDRARLAPEIVEAEKELMNQLHPFSFFRKVSWEAASG